MSRGWVAHPIPISVLLSNSHNLGAGWVAQAGGEPNLFFFSLRHQAVGAGPFAVFKGSAYEDGCGTSIMLAHASGSAQTGSPFLWTRR
jgi:hypothetical protein